MTLGAAGKAGAVIAVVGVFAIVAPAGARAAVTVGQTGPPTPLCSTGNGYDTDASYVQDSVFSGSGFQSSVSGVITSWSTYAGSTATQMKLDVLRPDPPSGADHFIPQQKDALRDIPATNAVVTFAGLHLRIASGDFIGIYIPPAGAYCLSFSACGACTSELYHHFNGDPAVGAPTFFNNFQTGGVLNASAVIEPDADGDGFGDETQDGCPANATAQGACPVASGTPQAIRRKCKQRKHRSLGATTAKKCKKKRK